MSARSDLKRVHVNVMNAKLMAWFCSIPEANRGSFEGKEIVVLGTFETQCFVKLISSKFEIRVILNVITASRILNVG